MRVVGHYDIREDHYAARIAGFGKGIADDLLDCILLENRQAIVRHRGQVKPDYLWRLETLQKSGGIAAKDLADYRKSAAFPQIERQSRQSKDHFFNGSNIRRGYLFEAVLPGLCPTICGEARLLRAAPLFLRLCRLDSRERGYPLSPRFPYAVVIFGTLSLIFYLFRSRGFARGLGSAAIFFAFLIALFIIDAVFAAIVLVLISLITRTPLPK